MKGVGIAGRIAGAFLTSRLTPLFVAAAVVLGVFAILVTPREEEPQISVPVVDVLIPYPGATAAEVESLVTTPAERVLGELAGVEYVYSAATSGMGIVTVRFEVGEDQTESIAKLYDKVMSNRDWLPANVGVGEPIVKPTGIDDVPIVTLTLWSDTHPASDLARVAHALETELAKVAGTGRIQTIGGSPREIRVALDPARMAGYGISPLRVAGALQLANQSLPAGELIAAGREIPVRTGVFLTDEGDIAGLVVGVYDGRPVHLSQVADIREVAAEPTSYVWHGSAGAGPRPAVTISVAKKAGQNAVRIARELLRTVDSLKGVVIPDGVRVAVTRNYGHSADEKADELLKHLLLATVAVVLFLTVVLGRREGVVVLVAIPVTILLTLFVSYLIGYTINRVTLFALIFSIGILVDDAIVVVENVHRRLKTGEGSPRELTVRAVDEVGSPTILATFTVIAALLPMAFVGGLMGPYMGPIPVNASLAMFFSLMVAFVVTPWMAFKVMVAKHPTAGHGAAQEVAEGRLLTLYRRLLTPLFEHPARRWGALAGVVALMLAAVSLAYFKVVPLKMLPFDNKSELQLVIDMPEGAALEETARATRAVTDYLATQEVVTDYQAYVGTASPINFNGLVRQYYRRQDSHMADVVVNLKPKHERDRQSHEIALALRPEVQRIARQHGANLKVVEVPPGPPVLAPIVAEVYGPDRDLRDHLALQVAAVMADTDGLVDVDSYVEADRTELQLVPDREKAARMEVAEADLVRTLHMALNGASPTTLHRAGERYAMPITLRLPQAMRTRIEDVLAVRVAAKDGALIPLGEVVRVARVPVQRAIYHKNGHPVSYVVADNVGAEDSPLYGLFRAWTHIVDRVRPPAGTALDVTLIGPPDDRAGYGIKWDGESQITYETFRDMGIAYAVGLLVIYLLVVGQFQSFGLPLVIMAPIPLTVIGIFPGHAIMGAQFTATSMIGMIALGGIIVRNSILLVDFIRARRAEGMELKEAIIQAGAVRTRPIVLTALAAMVGASVILMDPIFQGMAVSLLFGMFASTLLTLVVIPLIYYMAYRKGQDRAADAGV
ncbi:MAG: efflux RND transporter permease subunit [Nitrospirae bacterium]|nr:efflux RND transporter permease subunit [Nitrospirota bacterium]